ncbi:MAG: hypothetical protein JNK33_05530 [Candidatus Doudnabacteria bacterium]|nr:hypothetical protein [Candidatus Doudnabacteria bacterium]
MNIRHTFYLGLAIVLIAVGSVGAYKWGERRVATDHLVPSVVPPVQSPVAPPPAILPPPTEPVSKVYENDYMQVTVPAGWQLEELTQTLQDQTYNKATGLTTKTGEPVTTKTGAVTITKNNYILYIHPHAGQASGVTGGRFAEIAMGAPSADAVVTEQPSPPCGQTVTGANVNIPGVNLTRKDLYVSKADKKDYCVVPATGTAWYFSYVTDPKGGYINYYKAGELPGYVITMAYNSKDVNALPQKGTPELTTALADMTGIVKTLQLKQLGK